MCMEQYRDKTGPIIEWLFEFFFFFLVKYLKYVLWLRDFHVLFSDIKYIKYPIRNFEALCVLKNMVAKKWLHETPVASCQTTPNMALMPHCVGDVEAIRPRFSLFTA